MARKDPTDPRMRRPRASPILVPPPESDPPPPPELPPASDLEAVARELSTIRREVSELGWRMERLERRLTYGGASLLAIAEVARVLIERLS